MRKEGMCMIRKGSLEDLERSDTGVQGALSEQRYVIDATDW